MHLFFFCLDDVLKKHGISEIIYGPLYQPVIGQLCGKYLSPVIHRGMIYNCILYVSVDMYIHALNACVAY